MTPAEAKEEVQLLNLNNIRSYPCSASQLDDFYSLFNRFGPEAARTFMIPAIYNGELPKPSEVFS
jgi:hypothetical protein